MGGASALVWQILLGVVWAGYAAGAALGWGSRQLAFIMGDFGLSAAALIAAVSCFRYARAGSSRFRPAWLLFALSSFMASAGNAVWGWYEVVLGLPVPTPPWPTSSSSASRRPPSSACWSSPSAPSPGPAGSVSRWTPG